MKNDEEDLKVWVYIYICIYYIVEIHFSQILCTVRKVMKLVMDKKKLGRFQCYEIRRTLNINQDILITALEALSKDGAIVFSNRRRK